MTDDQAMQQEPISFRMPEEQRRAIQQLAGERKVRLSGEIVEGNLVVDAVSFANQEFNRMVFAPVNAPFKTAQANAG